MLNRILRKKNLYPLYSTFGTLLTYLLIFVIVNLLTNGDITILSGDLFSQYVAFIHGFLETLKNGENIWYSFSLYLGSNTAASYAYYCLSPLNLLYLIPGIPVYTLTLAIIACKLSLAAAALQFFFSKTLKRDQAYTILLSIAFPLSSFALMMQYNMIWLDALYILPILIYTIDHFVRTGRYTYLPLVYAYLFFTNFYMGYITGVFSAFVFLAFLFYHTPAIDKTAIKPLLKKCGIYMGCVLLAAGICCAILLPAADQLLSSRDSASTGFQAISFTLPDLFNNLFLGENQGMSSPIPLLYCGLPVLLLLPFYFTSTSISRKEKTLSACLLIFYLLGMQFMPIYKFLHAFEAPNWYAFRFSYCVVFLLLSLTARMIPYLREIPKRGLLVYAAGLILFYSVMIPFQQTTLPFESANDHSMLLLNALFIAVYTAAILLINENRFTRLSSVIVTIFFIAELVLNGIFCFRGNNIGLLSKDYVNSWEATESDLLQALPDLETYFSRIRFHGEQSLNAPSYFQYPGLVSFSTTDTPALRNTLSSLGISTSFMTLYDHGYTDVAKMLLDVRYEGDLRTGSIQSFPYALPIGYMVSSSITTFVPSNNPFASQMDLIRCMTDHPYPFYEELSLDIFNVKTQNMEIIPLGDSLVFQHISDISNNGVVILSPKNEIHDPIMIFFEPWGEGSMDLTAPQVIGEPEGFNKISNLSDRSIIAFAPNDEGLPELTLQFFSGPNYDYRIKNLFLYTYHPDLLADCFNDLIRQPLYVTHWENGEIRGVVNATEDRPVLFTSIPYEKGWQAYVDGVPAKVLTSLNGSFIALALTPGAHEILLSYEPPYQLISCAVTSICLLLWLWIWLKRNKNKASEATQNEN